MFAFWILAAHRTESAGETRERARRTKIETTEKKGSGGGGGRDDGENADDLFSRAICIALPLTPSVVKTGIPRCNLNANQVCLRASGN